MGEDMAVFFPYRKWQKPEASEDGHNVLETRLNRPTKKAGAPDPGMDPATPAYF
jgi:hypothetical protein